MWRRVSREPTRAFVFDSQEVLEQMRVDKKSRASSFNLILPRAVGDVRVTSGVPDEVTVGSLNEFLGGGSS